MIRDQFKEYPVAVSYKNIRAELDTGDIVVFGGNTGCRKLSVW
ncbi:MAG: hypothetical protein U1E82_12290 [Nitrosomonas sp.]